MNVQHFDLSKDVITSAYVHVGAQTNEGSSKGEPSSQPADVFFVPGNPGCIGYYNSFLPLLHENLLSSSYPCNVFGTSMYNFDNNGHSSKRKTSRFHVLGLQGQIEYVEACLDKYVEARLRLQPGQPPLRVILVGHSVGAYVALEVLRRRNERARQNEEASKLHIVGLVGLWPTITWIAESSRGRRLGWLLSLPLLAIVVGTAAQLLAACLPRMILELIVYHFTKFPASAVQTTADFVSSPAAIYQALFMARDEMKTINEDRWTEEIWGSESISSSRSRPRLVFCFGKNDHWVADHHRDALIAARASRDGKRQDVKMLIDKTNIPHSFCISHSRRVAELCAGWIMDILRESDQTT